jgi:hypothetical protein
MDRLGERRGELRCPRLWVAPDALGARCHDHVAMAVHATWHTCPRCGERLGAYEPLVLEFSDGTRLRGGLLALSERGDGVEANLSHARCVDAELSEATVGPR